MSHIKNHIGISTTIKLFLIVISLQLSFTSAQTKTNLQVFYNLVDSSVAKINQKITTPDLKINFTTGNYFDVFQNQVISDFLKLGKTVLSDSANNNSDVTRVNYTIDNANIKYGEMERDGFFGDFIMPRKIELSGSYSLSNNIIKAEKFNFTYKDTVAVDKVKVIEYPFYPFTHGEVPSEPFFSSLFEPVVAISSAALAVILFFTIRSK
ncbi:MAG: hypothetical protein WB779_06595 [Ignavibacteriaceae bacterium]